MGAALAITFREAMEAALVLAVVLAYLGKGRDRLGSVWGAVLLAIALSIGAALLGYALIGTVETGPRQLVLALIGFAAVGALTWIVMPEREGVSRLADGGEAARALVRQPAIAVGLLAFLAVLREGLEWAFLTLPVLSTSSLQDWAAGSAAGLSGALMVAGAIYRGSRRASADVTLRVTSGLLVVVAAGLLSRSVAELQGAGVLPTVRAPIWDASSNEWLSSGPLAQLLEGLLGWNPRPSAEEALAWIAYVAVVAVAVYGRRDLGALARQARYGLRPGA